MLFFHALVRHVEQLGLATGNGKFECCSNFAHGQLHATRNDLAEAKVNLALPIKRMRPAADRKSGLLGNKSLEELLLGQLHAMVWTGSRREWTCMACHRTVRASGSRIKSAMGSCSRIEDILCVDYGFHGVYWSCCRSIGDEIFFRANPHGRQNIGCCSVLAMGRLRG